MLKLSLDVVRGSLARTADLPSPLGNVGCAIFEPLGGGPVYAGRQELANAGGGNVALARGWLRHQRGVANLAVEHEPLRVQGALRLLDEEPRRLRQDRHKERRRHGAKPELVRSTGDRQPGPDPRALTRARPGHAGTALTIQGAVWLRRPRLAAPQPAAYPRA